MRLAQLAGAACLLLLGACTPSDPAPAPQPSAKPPASCSVDVLAGWKSAGLAVLWAGPPLLQEAKRTALPQLPAVVTAIDVRNGQVRSYCPLPGPDAKPVVAQDQVLTLRQGGAEFPPFLTDIDVLLRTQYFSPDFRWFAAPGLPLVDVAGGKIVTTDWSGTITGLGRDVALIKSGDAWCTRSLPPKAGEACTALPAQPGGGSFVIGSAGTPVWVSADAQPYQFGSVTGYAATDGTRIYRADYFSAAERLAQTTKLNPTDPPIDLDPAGLGGFITSVPTPPRALQDVNDWFSVVSVGDGTVQTRYHRTASPSGHAWLWGAAYDRSRAIVDGGTVAVSAVYDWRMEGGLIDGKETISTRFGAVVDKSSKVYDLSRDRGLACPQPGAFCRILAWPDGSLTDAPTPAP